MSRTRLLASTLLTLLACSALAANTAAAEEKTKMLPESGVTFTSKQVGESQWTTLGGIFAISCPKSKGSGTIESANLGKFKATLEGCNAAGGTENCTTVGQSKGIITSEGTYHFWLAKETLSGVNTLVGALVMLPTETHFTCVIFGLNQLVIFKGCDAALATPLNTLTKITKDTFATSGTAGDQLITKVLPQEKTTEETCLLLSSKNGEAFVGAALTLTVENENFKSGATAVTVLLMNPEAKE